MRAGQAKLSVRARDDIYSVAGFCDWTLWFDGVVKGFQQVCSYWLLRARVTFDNFALWQLLARVARFSKFVGPFLLTMCKSVNDCRGFACDLQGFQGCCNRLRKLEQT